MTRRKNPNPDDRLPWVAGTFLIATLLGPYPRKGLTYRDLGMWMAHDGSARHTRVPAWSLTHLGTGHRLCNINAHDDDAFEIATEIARVGDWSFVDFEGWRFSDPDLKDRFIALAARHKACERFPNPHRSPESAAEIARYRAGEQHDHAR